MAQETCRPGCFVLEAFDLALWCPIAQAPFQVTDIDDLRSILGLAAEDDPNLDCLHHMEDEEVAAVVSKFDAFDPRSVDGADLTIRLYRRPDVIEAPYLVHTGWELPLLLDGRKKLARFSDAYPPATFYGEDAFDRWAADGVLHKEVVDEPFEKPIGRYLGHRTVYYTPKGEEWRIPAYKLIEKASEKGGGWNEDFTRLEGMLFGYEDWQNDWWIKTLLEQGALGGATFCCAVTAAGLAWAESAGLRALPPIEPNLQVIAYRRKTSDVDLKELLLVRPDSAAVMRFTVARLHLLQHIIDSRQDGPWAVPGHQIPELNQHLNGAVVVAARCEPHSTG
ncbi:MAG TPA: hypothetical protein VG758_19345 [Hyphomicrobiaceae bacterium]|jgi:hypothetical protein|nr:hypothetical protein [Hyphomicrobiaceae bacterium]